MRAYYSKGRHTEIFTLIKEKSGFSWKDIACFAGVSLRTLSYWRSGQSSISYSFIKKVETSFQVILPKPDKLISSSEVNSISGKIVGIQRNKIHGNPGTSEGRSRGGKMSLGKMKKISFPEKCAELAELFGIILGDGGITKRQVTITLHKTDDRMFAEYVKSQMEKLFQTEVALRERRNTNVISIVISRTALVNYLEELGLGKGNKVKQQAKVPEWITENDEYAAACLRGLFDTDGCTYVDKHVISGNLYLNIGMNFTNRSLPLLAFFFTTLEKFGYRHT